MKTNLAHNNIVKYYSQEELKGTFEKIKTLLIILLKNNTTEATVKDVISLYESGICRQKIPSNQITSSNLKEKIIITLLIFSLLYFDNSESKDKDKSIGDILSSLSEPCYQSTVWFVARMINNENIGQEEVLNLIQSNESVRNTLIEAFVSEICTKNNNTYDEIVDNCLKKIKIPQKGVKL